MPEFNASSKAPIDGQNKPEMGPSSPKDYMKSEDCAHEPGRSTPDPEYTTGLKLFLVMVSLGMSTSLVGLELGIISTAIPGITDNFRRLQDVGWYGSSTFLVVASASSMWGKIYKYLNVKFAYLTSIFLLLVGSVVSAAAPNSASVIVGRAIQGLGIGGNLSGSVIIINLVSHPKSHPMLIGIWTGIIMASSILGPLIGGAFTTGVSWRWCFWINLPLGVPVIAGVVFLIRIPKHVKPHPATWKEIIFQLDVPGFTLLIGSLVCLDLALQQGGLTHPWSAASTIALLTLWPCLTIIFLIVEWYQGERAIVPLAILTPRLTWSNALFAFFINATNYMLIFYLPIYFQSIHGMSAVKSGIQLLPFLAFFAFGAMSSGVIIGKTRYLQPYQLISGMLSTTAMGLFYTLKINSSRAWYIGPQVLLGFGIGFGHQVPMTAVQGLSKPENMASSSALILTMYALSGTYCIPVAQSIFANYMLKTLQEKNPSMNAHRVIGTGASEIHDIYRGTELSAVIDAYMVGIKNVFAFALTTAALTFVMAFVVPFVRLLDHSNQNLNKTGDVGSIDEKNGTRVDAADGAAPVSA